MSEKFYTRKQRLKRQRKRNRKLRRSLHAIDAGVLRPWQEGVVCKFVTVMQDRGALPPGEFKINSPATLRKEDWLELDLRIGDVLRKQGMPAAAEFFFGDPAEHAADTVKTIAQNLGIPIRVFKGE